MRPRSREINVFSMSLLDILCGALGAFCFLMLALFPSYNKPAPDNSAIRAERRQQLDKAKRALSEEKAKLPAPLPGTEQLTTENERLKKEIREAREVLEQEKTTAQRAEKRNVQTGSPGQNVLLFLMAIPPQNVVASIESSLGGWNVSLDRKTPEGKVFGDDKRSVYWNMGGGIRTMIHDSPSADYRIYYEKVGEIPPPSPPPQSIVDLYKVLGVPPPVDRRELDVTVTTRAGQFDSVKKPYPSGGRQLYFTASVDANGRVTLR